MESLRIGSLKEQQGTVYLEVVFTLPQFNAISKYVRFNVRELLDTASRNGIRHPAPILSTGSELELLICVEHDKNIWLVRHLLEYLCKRDLLTGGQCEALLENATRRL
jgi:hypothetical protein